MDRREGLSYTLYLYILWIEEEGVSYTLWNMDRGGGSSNIQSIEKRGKLYSRSIYSMKRGERVS